MGCDHDVQEQCFHYEIAGHFDVAGVEDTINNDDDLLIGGDIVAVDVELVFVPGACDRLNILTSLFHFAGGAVRQLSWIKLVGKGDPDEGEVRDGRIRYQSDRVGCCSIFGGFHRQQHRRDDVLTHNGDQQKAEKEE